MNYEGNNLNNREINNRLRELKTEDFIWIIYVAIIFLSWMSNYIEKKYFLNNDLKAKEDYRKIITIIFSILVVIYVYFLLESINDLKGLKTNDSEKKKLLVFLSFLGSLLILISGLIFLYISINDEDIDVELAFN